MLGSITYLALQQYWWVIISLLASLLVFMMFVQGGQTLIRTIGKNDDEKSLIVNSLGRKWELTFTTLVTFGGAFFASFPLFYSTSFGGAYWVWILILFAFILQAVSYEYRSKPNNFLGKKTFDVFLFINGAVGTILIGTAVGTLFTGGNFSVNKMNLVNFEGLSYPVISAWQSPWHGLEAVLNPMNLALGLSVFCLVRILALQYFMNAINDQDIFIRSKSQIWVNFIPFLVFFLYFVIRLLCSGGFVYDAGSQTISVESYKYLHNFMEMPVIAVIFLCGVILVLTGILISLLKNSANGIWFTGIGTILSVFGLLLAAGFNHTAYYPSLYDAQSSLTIENSSSSFYTLKVMSVVSLLVPFVLIYIIWVWRSINNRKLDKGELESDVVVY